MPELELFLEQNFLWILALVMIWVLPWKGYALWSAAQLSHKWWFIALLLINTLAILDIIYIFFVAKKRPFSQAQDEESEA
ncbi:hypothetical protein CL630_02775 [bacterium]|nr:hypothetical protein [bacterium]|tara:strand:+ start:8333 stop:8572 length:240 start_codon:yes stop_codon:yes gene_type:complete